MSDTNSADSSKNSKDGAAEVNIDPYDLDFLRNPYPHHDLLRDVGPVFQLPQHGVWATARHDECNIVLKDWETYISSAGVGMDNFNKVEPFRSRSPILEVEPPDHDRSRTVIGRALGQKQLRALREQTVKVADELIDEMTEKLEFDGIADFAAKFPLYIFPLGLGLDESLIGSEKGKKYLLGYAELIANNFGPQNELRIEAQKNVREYTEWNIEQCKRESLSPGGFGHVIYEAVDAGEITAEEAGGIVRGLLTAGVDTTIAALGNALLLFAEHPDQWDLLREDPSQATYALDEVVRHSSIVQTMFRTTSKPTELSGVLLDANEKILLFVGAANRDPKRWENPDKFDITRRPTGSLGFSAGIHRCAGQQLARMEFEILFSKLAKRVKRIELTGTPVRRPNNVFYKLESLPVRLIPA